MGVGHMSRPLARRCLAPGTTVAPGEVMVATEIGDQRIVQERWQVAQRVIAIGGVGSVQLYTTGG